MALNKFPGTHVTAELLEPVHSNICEIFYEEPPENQGTVMGSVNAGTSYTGSLFEVGHDGMPGAFYGILSAQQNFVGRHPYQKVHMRLFRLSEDAEEFAVGEFEPDIPVQFSLIQKPPAQSACIDYDGMVFIDVVRNELRPYQINANYAMIYVVPPMGNVYGTPTDFLNAVEASAENIVRAVMNYNKNYTGMKSPHSLNLQPINTIRLSLFSGGYFNTFELSHDQIAAYIYRGVANELHSKDTSIQTIQFENNHYEIIENDIKFQKQDFSSIPDLI